MSTYKEWLQYNDKEKRPVTREVYYKYYKEGKDHFLACLDPNNEDHPYDDDTYYKSYPWYDGCREASGKYFQEKYKIAEFQKEVKQLVKKYGFRIEYDDEYNNPMVKTPEGFDVGFY